MKRLTSLFLLLSTLFSFIACSSGKGGTDADSDLPPVSDNEEINNTPTVVVPEYKDYQRGTVDYTDVTYSRPNIEAIEAAIDSVTQAIRASDDTFAEQISKISSLEDGLDDLKTMYAIAEIQRSKDSSVGFWQDEYAYISTNYPRITHALEELLVECARSEHKDGFEDEYFGCSLDGYLDGGVYTDEAVALMAREAELESEYSSLSTANVNISYKSVTGILWEGTADEVIAMAREHFKNDDAGYKNVLSAITLLYEKARRELAKPIYVELIRIRHLIADELGLDSYSELAYDELGYGHTEKDMLELIADVGRYAAPVASDLEYTVFGGFFKNNVQPMLDNTILINTLYSLYSELGADYKDAYSYMLQHGLCDVSKKADNRFDGAFTTYLDSNNSPYLFVSTSGFIKDYMTLSHEFGHFLDGYVNYGGDDSLELAEVSSQALELLTVLELKGHIRSQDYQYLEYYSMFTYLNSVILLQSFYSAFEHLAYRLEYDEIDEDKLEDIVEDAFEAVYGEDMSIEGDLSYVMMTHTVLYPFYVESYVTSGLVALDIFFTESYRTGKEREGFKLYEKLIDREGKPDEFSEMLEVSGIESPFADSRVKEIANKIYFQIIGKNYYKGCNDNVGAA